MLLRIPFKMVLRIRLQEHVFAGKTIDTSIVDGDDALYI
jgi:hypothetical protein